MDTEPERPKPEPIPSSHYCPVVVVEVLQAVNLQSTDGTGVSNSYVELVHKELDGRLQHYRTTVAYRSSHPVWRHQVFRLTFPPYPLMSLPEMLTLQIKDKASFFGDTVLGTARVDLSSICSTPELQTLTLYPLEGQNTNIPGHVPGHLGQLLVQVHLEERSDVSGEFLMRVAERIVREIQAKNPIRWTKIDDRLHEMAVQFYKDMQAELHAQHLRNSDVGESTVWFRPLTGPLTPAKTPAKPAEAPAKPAGQPTLTLPAQTKPAGQPTLTLPAQTTSVHLQTPVKTNRPSVPYPSPGTFLSRLFGDNFLSDSPSKAPPSLATPSASVPVASSSSPSTTAPASLTTPSAVSAPLASTSSPSSTATTTTTTTTSSSSSTSSTTTSSTPPSSPLLSPLPLADFSANIPPTKPKSCRRLQLDIAPNAMRSSSDPSSDVLTLHLPLPSADNTTNGVLSMGGVPTADPEKMIAEAGRALFLYGHVLSPVAKPLATTETLMMQPHIQSHIDINPKDMNHPDAILQPWVMHELIKRAPARYHLSKWKL
eukprot:g14183.t1